MIATRESLVKGVISNSPECPAPPGGDAGSPVGSRDREDTDFELFVFITPHVIYTDDDMLEGAYRGDDDFNWTDPGDLRAAARSARYYLANRDKVRGRSTITQQLAKILFLTPERSLWRKVREAVLALRATVLRPEPVEVRAEPLARGRVEETVTNTRAGTVKARRRAQLAPEVGGRVVAITHREGERVTAGEEDDCVVIRVRDDGKGIPGVECFILRPPSVSPGREPDAGKPLVSSGAPLRLVRGLRTMPRGLHARRPHRKM